MEKFNSIENTPPSREQVVEMLTNRGIEDQEVKDMLIQYQIAQEQIADILDSQYKHEEVVIHMAELYFDANYREYAIESLEELIDTLSRIPDVGESIDSAKGHMLDELYNKIEAARRRMLDRME